jgi:2-polyprenyl-3-methyl-5-hydroxy-6-metoxy-1,4-benzoquinol methylase
MLQIERGREALMDTILYIFTELSVSDCQLMYDEVVEASEAQLSEEASKIDLLNAKYMAIMIKVFLPSEKSYPMTHKEFLNEKSQKIADVILRTQPGLARAKPKKTMLDIGCGDCHMTSHVAQKIGAYPTGVDLAGSGQDMWVGNVGQHADLAVTYYDGVHLIEALKEDTFDHTQLYDVITINHVLHHYPGREAQVQGFQRALALLKEGGVLLFSEHATVLNDEEIELQHVLFDIKATLGKDLKENLKPTMAELEALCGKKIKMYLRDKHEGHYFSRPLLEMIAKTLGLEPVIAQSRLDDGSHDASHTAIIGFKKITPTLTPAELALYKPLTIKELFDVRPFEMEVDPKSKGCDPEKPTSHKLSASGAHLKSLEAEDSPQFSGSKHPFFDEKSVDYYDKAHHKTSKGAKDDVSVNYDDACDDKKNTGRSKS